MKKLLFIFLFPFSLIAQSSLSLEDCIQKTIATHPTYQSGIIASEAATVGIRQAKSQRLPTMSAGVFQSANFGRSIDRFTNAYIDQVYNSTYAQANLSMPLFQGFQIQNSIAQNQKLQAASIYGIQSAKNQLSLLTIQAYLEVLTSQELYAVAQKQVSSTREQLTFLQKQIDAGTIGKGDYLQLETQLGQGEFAVLSAKNNLDLAQNTLKQLTGILPNGDIEIQRIDGIADFDYDINEILSEAYQNSPDIKSFEETLESYVYETKAIRGRNLPQVDLYYNWNTLYASSNPDQEFFEQLNATRNSSITLGLSIPIFGRLQSKPFEQQVAIKTKTGQNQISQAKLELRQNIERAYAQFTAASGLLNNATNQLSISQENLNIQETQFRAGTKGPLDYIVAQQNFNQANTAFINIKYQLIFQEKILRLLMNGD